MKQGLLLVTIMMTASVFAVEEKDLMPLIVEASLKRESAYVEVRNKITGYGTNALPILAEIGADASLPWQQQLVARICYERIERKDNIEKLLATNWYNHPKFDPSSRYLITGPDPVMGTIIVPDMKEAGLWYNYLEVLWKMPGDKASIRHNNSTELWLFWCTEAIKDNSETRVWFIRVCSEIIANPPPDPTPPPQVLLLHNTLFRQEKPDAAPLLIQHLQKREIKGDISRFVLKLAGYADSRSADALENLAKSRQQSEDFAPLVAELRARPAPPPDPEIFRVGTNIIKRAKQP